MVKCNLISVWFDKISKRFICVLARRPTKTNIGCLTALGIMGDHLKAPWNPSIRYCCNSLRVPWGVSSVGHTLLPRVASLSDRYTPDGCSFFQSGQQCVKREKWKKKRKNVCLQKRKNYPRRPEEILSFNKSFNNHKHTWELRCTFRTV